MRGRGPAASPSPHNWSPCRAALAPGYRVGDGLGVAPALEPADARGEADVSADPVGFGDGDDGEAPGPCESAGAAIGPAELNGAAPPSNGTG